jgi:hypothetical protein
MASPTRSIQPVRSGTVSGASSSQAAEWLGTVGWAAKGVVYLLIALVAVQLAFGNSDDAASKQGALRKLVEQPAGSILLTLVVVGLFAYAAYRLFTVFTDDGDDKKRVTHAITRLASAAAYAVVGVQGVQILLSNDSGQSGNEAPKTWSARLLDSGPGTALLIAVGLGLLAFAGYQLYKGVTKKFMEKLDPPTSGHPSSTTIERVGMVGIIARGVVAALLGIFVMQAVIQHDPNQAQGLDGALREVQQAAFGSFLLLVVALGLGAYGAFALISSRCRRHAAG